MDPGPTAAERTKPGLTGRPPQLNILMVASEAAPWAKTGGLGDVVAGLSDALDRLGHVRLTHSADAARSVLLDQWRVSNIEFVSREDLSEDPS